MDVIYVGRLKGGDHAIFISRLFRDAARIVKNPRKNVNSAENFDNLGKMSKIKAKTLRCSKVIHVKQNLTRIKNVKHQN